MSQAKRSGTLAMEYRYNDRGEQVRRFLGTTNTYTVYDEAGHWLGDYDSNGKALQQAIWLDDLPVGVLAGTALNYVQPDHLGTPRTVIDPVRDVAIWKWDIKGEAFGNTPPDQDADRDGTPFVFGMRFPGQRYDGATGLNQNYFRDYDSGTGSYVESDPSGLLGGISTFAYGGSNALYQLDIFGLANSGVTTKIPGGKPTTVRIDNPHVDGQQRHAHVCERGCKEIVVNEDGSGSHGTDPRDLKNRVRAFLRGNGFNVSVCAGATFLAKGVARDRCLKGDASMCEIFKALGGEVIDDSTIGI
ncbi:RHS repeat-associated core domain-containing protein [Xanthomonas translucens pv. poae]|uniref:RHS repeat-associated core domain-containing protein n=5 Tax=Xanthomonas translucens group TaxID=3390202 RepID=A0A0K3A124_9XANT|nr:RHS repeat-associated core domain-containing protein [Xanthomonas translucens pv. poae]